MTSFSKILNEKQIEIKFVNSKIGAAELTVKTGATSNVYLQFHNVNNLNIKFTWHTYWLVLRASVIQLPAKP